MIKFTQIRDAVCIDSYYVTDDSHELDAARTNFMIYGSLEKQVRCCQYISHFPPTVLHVHVYTVHIHVHVYVAQVLWYIVGKYM